MKLKLETDDGQDVCVSFEGSNLDCVTMTVSDVMGSEPLFTVEEINVISAMLDIAVGQALRIRDELEDT